MYLTANPILPSQEDEKNSVWDKANQDNKPLGFELDLSAYKVVTPYQENETVTNLKEINNLVDIYIPLPEEHRGKTGYGVYRYHDNGVDVIPLAPDKNQYGEYFRIDGDNIILTVYRFSIYAIAYEENADNNDNEDNTDNGYHAPYYPPISTTTTTNDDIVEPEEVEIEEDDVQNDDKDNIEFEPEEESEKEPIVPVTPSMEIEVTSGPEDEPDSPIDDFEPNDKDEITVPQNESNPGTGVLIVSTPVLISGFAVTVSKLIKRKKKK